MPAVYIQFTEAGAVERVQFSTKGAAPMVAEHVDEVGALKPLDPSVATVVAWAQASIEAHRAAALRVVVADLAQVPADKVDAVLAAIAEAKKDKP